ncbi:hypothetical protein N7G274_010485 [Stereocaulon virgatum]|uniref:Uncharacterized protein n=1 Tax=Stereocaulon virgatum TaxID=373712 RepID=A0ABR3ZV56_9LECA
MHDLGREAQVPSLLEAYGIPFTFAATATSTSCMDKSRTKMILDHVGFDTAPFATIPGALKLILSCRHLIRYRLRSNPHAMLPLIGNTLPLQNPSKNIRLRVATRSARSKLLKTWPRRLMS